VTDGPLFSVICATLVRPSYSALVSSVRRQTFHDFEFIARSDPGNEYIARNRAVAQARGTYCVFCDDDALLRPNHLALLARAIASNESPPALGGPLQGNMFGGGTVLLNEPGWGVGANMTIRRDVLNQRGGFEETWGLPRTPRGWRADTDMWWWIEDAFLGGATWIPDLVVDHPGIMTSVWEPDVEGVFFRRWRKRYIARFAPVDPRGQEFLLRTQDLTADEKAEVLKCRRALRSRVAGMPELPEERGPP
jgi:glycosyltransferase involved in cell wall biosynthesis